MKRQIGDKAKIKYRKGANHRFLVGEKVTIAQVYDDHYKAKNDDDFWWVAEDDLEDLEEEVVANK